MPPWSSLSEADREAVRAAQAARKAQRVEKKRSATRADDEETSASSAAAPPPPIQPGAAATRRDDDKYDEDDGLHVTRCEVSQDEYFDACPHGMFRDPSLPPTAASLDLLLRALEADDEQAADLNQCNYFLFSGPQEALWDAEFNARLAWEGFFTITSRTGPRRQIEPLPELQPFYGVLLWPNFEASKHVRKALARMARAPRNGYVLSNCVDPDRTWERLEAYHKVRHTSNWLTRRYFEMMKAASDDPTVNFTLHCVELTEAPQRAEGAADAASEEGATPTPRALPVVDGCRVRIEGLGGRADLNGSEGVASRYDSAAGRWVIQIDGGGSGPSPASQPAALAARELIRVKPGNLRRLPPPPEPIAGEIGFSVGGVYTSLSGFSAERSTRSVGTCQLVLLGRWLKLRGYAFWSLGHCYSPAMDYKRQLGHRIYTREQFRALLKRHRGPFKLDAAAARTAGKGPAAAAEELSVVVDSETPLHPPAAGAAPRRTFVPLRPHETCDEDILLAATG